MTFHMCRCVLKYCVGEALMPQRCCVCWQGYEVHVIVDGVSSQRLGDRAVAIQVLGPYALGCTA